MTQSEKYAYIAGIIDGEGCIYFAVEKNRTRVRLQISNTYKELLEKIKEFTGVGNISNGIQTNKNWKVRYDWTCYNKTSVEILEKCLPYLIIKKKQAEAAIGYMNGELETSNARDIIKLLNRKGVSHAV